ncbi:hypothetical protein P4U97_02840 [Bacillus swezeyi]|uniref:hypothetical protein n=1 Tax=Bacillus swezeyi TaxID=1925020 RepID=UPI002E252192|nr:hypothetical protein [Bacillus swezeyi]
MTIIVTIIAAVIVIIGLVVFNVRSASPAKPEPAEEPRVERTSPVQVEEEAPEAPEPASGENDQYVMTDQTYREILQKFQTPKEQNNAPKEEMDDMDYRNALKSMKKRDQD